MFFSDLWAYKTSVKDTTVFTPFQLVYIFVLPIKCEIPSLKLVVELLPNRSLEKEHFFIFDQN